MKFKAFHGVGRSFRKHCPTFAKGYDLIADTWSGINNRSYEHLLWRNHWITAAKFLVNHPEHIGAAAIFLDHSNPTLSFSASASFANAVRMGIDISHVVPRLIESLWSSNNPIMDSAGNSLRGNIATCLCTYLNNCSPEKVEAVVKEIDSLIQSEKYTKEAEKNTVRYVEVAKELASILVVAEQQMTSLTREAA
ncbi:MAG: hypothetical protein Q7S22_06200 [Candidatus Micrarchaeota archaeon]|nr:hypothetical protein [Candidatus Micrarchaeota archaeon]